MEVKAQAKFQRITPKKVRLVASKIRGKNIAQAREQLQVLPNKASIFILKVLESALANAKSKKSAKEEDLSIKQICIDEGPTLKRWRARAFGKAAQIKKRTCHIIIVLSDKEKDSKITSNQLPITKKNSITNNQNSKS